MMFLLSLLLMTSIHASEIPLLDSHLEGILSVQESALENVEAGVNKSLGEWVLDGQKTDLAVSKSGLLGFSAVKGTTAVELSWNKKSKSMSYNKNEKTQGVALNSSMNEEDVLLSVRPVFKILFKNKERGYAHIQKNMEDHIIRYHRALQGVASTTWQSYTPKKFRLDLSASFSSPLFGFSKLSGDTRLRLEWKILKSSSKNQLIQDQSVVQNLLADLDEALKNAEIQEGYKLKEVSVGLGLSKKNLLSFSNIRGGIAGELFFKKNSKALPKSNTSKLEGNYIIENENKILQRLKRRKFRKGLKKSLKTTNWFAEKFAARGSSWEVGKFKTSFSLSYSGFLGLSNLSSSSLVTFTFKK